jgi:uncharacterized membrane protein
MAFTIAYFVLDVNRYYTFSTGGDFGDFLRSVADPTGLLQNSTEGSHFSSHFSPIYDAIMPFVVFTHSYIPLLAAQAIAGGAVIVGIFAIAQRFLPPRAAFLAATLAAVYPPLVGVIFGDPYETVFAPAITVWLCFSVIERRWMLSMMFLIGLLAVKEDQSIFILWAGFLTFVKARHERDRALQKGALASMLVSLVVFFSFIILIRPAFAHGSQWHALAFTAQAATTDKSGGTSILGRLGYCAEMLIPLMALPLAAPRVLALAIPAIAEVLLPKNSMVWTMGQHYAGVWIGFVLVAAVFGVGAVWKRSPIVAQRLMLASITISVFMLVFASPTHWRVNVHFRNAHDRVLDSIITEKLPRASTLGAGDAIYAHLWEMPGTQHGLWKSPQYALIDTTSDAALEREMRAEILSERYGRYQALWNDDGVILYRKVPTFFPTPTKG